MSVCDRFSWKAFFFEGWSGRSVEPSDRIRGLVSGPCRQTLRFSAEVLPRLATSSYSTVWPSLSVDRPAFSTAEIWTNTSLPPPLGWMNPYPLVGLNHFTVPLAIHESPQQLKQ